MISSQAKTPLLPCPFCGNDEVGIESSYLDGEQLFVVRCDCCGATQAPDQPAAVAMLWNQRAPRPDGATKPFEMLEHPVMGRFQIIKPEPGQ